MSDFEPAFVHDLSVQSWSTYAFGMFFILLRFYARIKRLGVRGLQLDDYLMMLVGILYTTLVVCLNVIAGGGGSNLYPPGDFDTFTPEQIQDRIQGSKIVIVSEQAMLNVIYTIKACMLIMYSRLTLGLQVRRMAYYLAIYVSIGWFSTQIAFFTACRPFSGYWAMPPPNPQCTTLEHYAIVQGCFNITSDLLMLGIPLPLITRLNVPLKQKSVLFLVFSMGIFVIIAALLTKIFNLSDVWDPSYMLWYTREASVAVYVSNLPLIWPLLRELFPILKSLAPRSKAPMLQTPKYDLTSSSHNRKPDNYDPRVSEAPSETALTSAFKKSDDIHAAELPSEDVPPSNFLSELESNPSRQDIKEEKPSFPAPTYHELPAPDWDPENRQIHMTTTFQISEEHVYSDSRPSSKPTATRNDQDTGATCGYSWARD
ncbi:hypothetical protein K3495_g10202 [Podosphaera aphanis]|nr:hypothetical protein K3495_g10202 [Podosphaera aphanis]